MKGMLIILDGLGDLPNERLGGKTPLEAADTPNLDFLATRGEMGYMYPVKSGFIPESDEAIVSIFGNSLISSTRGQLEARGTDLKLTRGDLAFRVNFATIDSMEKGNILDRRAGRTLTTAETQVLAKAINKIKLPCKFIFKPTVQHRGALIFRGGFSDNLMSNDLTYSQGKSKVIHQIRKCQALDELENTEHTTKIVNQFLEKAHKILKNHPINKKRKEKGLMPANYLLVRGAGIEPPKLKTYKRWLSIAYMPLEIGFSKTSEMKVFSFNYPKLKKLDAYENLYTGLKKMCKFSIKTLKKNHTKNDYAYIHINETDFPGHDNKPLEKKEMIEFIDKNLFSFLRTFAPKNEIKIIVTGNYSTPCKLKNHSADPVPVLFYNNSIPKEKKFCEKEAQTGNLKAILGKDLLKKAGFSR